MNYPQEPGYKAEGTSAQAAKEITSKAATVRDRVLALLRSDAHKYYGLTPDEAADILGESILTVRPRFSELRAKGLIHDSGKRRANASGKMAVIWLAFPAGQLAI